MSTRTLYITGLDKEEEEENTPIMVDAELTPLDRKPFTAIEQAAITETITRIERSVFEEGGYFYLDEVWGVSHELSHDAFQEAVGRVRSEVKKCVLQDRFGLPTEEVLDPYAGQVVIGRRVDEKRAVGLISSGALPNVRLRKVSKV